MSFVTLSHLSKFATAFAEKVTELFVRKESGKGLSSNDYTTEEKEKLKGISEGANQTTVDVAQMERLQMTLIGPLCRPTWTAR